MSIWKKQNIIYYNKKQFERLIPLCDQDGDIYKGRDGKIYRDPFLGKAIKIYHDHRSLTNAMNAFSFLNHEVLKENNVIVPEEKVVKRGKLVGYSMQLVKGFTIAEIQTLDSIPEISFSAFYEAYTQAFKNLNFIAREEVLVYDMHEKNIMYDIKDNCFKFIDIDEWKKSNLTLVSTVKHNVRQFIGSVNLDKIKMKLKD